MWKLCMDLRAAKTSTEAAPSIREDVHLYQEMTARLSAPIKKDTPPPRERQWDQWHHADQDKRKRKASE